MIRYRSISIKIILGSIATIALVLFAFSLPHKIFTDPTSTILYSEEGRLLGAHIASDGQWRFPESNEVPEKFKQAILTFEDKNFYYHPGIDFKAVARALWQDIKAQRVVSGGSTITMQVIRISRKGKERSVYQKLIEMLLALRMETTYTKSEILALYTSHAPFGSNVVGLEAASWRFFGRDPNDLSWAESATLAILPNAPSMIYPGKNNAKFKAKRDRLLDKMLQRGIMDTVTCSLAKLEPIPTNIHRLPYLAPHLLDYTYLNHPGQRVKSTVNYSIQNQVNTLVNKQQEKLAVNKIFNIAVLVLDVETGKTMAYVGNSKKIGKQPHGNQVDIIRSARSTGSVLKPFLYASMLQNGEILPKTLIPDIPTQIAGYSPKNFNLKFDGAVPANEALYRSLNVPFVRMLKDHGVDQFHFLLKKLGLTTINRPADHYGLSLILGGAEGTLWDLCGAYASMGRVVNHYNQYQEHYFANDIHAPYYICKNSITKGHPTQEGLLEAGALYQTFNAMLEVTRPYEEGGWQSFSSSQKIAWKTGTSFGCRDAWALGLTPKYMIGVWVGNADGEGRPHLTGVTAAAPIMFDVFKMLPQSTWFEEPMNEMTEIRVCHQSGYRASRWCTEVDTSLILHRGLRAPVCPYHKLIHLDHTKRFQVTSACESIDKMVHTSWFVLPPVMEWYYKKRNPLYRSLPPFKAGCSSSTNTPMEIIYPQTNDQIFVPKTFNGTIGKVVFKVAHHNPKAKLFWDIDGNYIATTTEKHQIEISPSEGDHILTLMDQEGNILKKKFTIVGDSKKSNLKL